MFWNVSFHSNIWALIYSLDSNLANLENGTDGLGNDQNDQDDQDDQDEEKMIRTELMNISTKKEENVNFWKKKHSKIDTFL